MAEENLPSYGQNGRIVPATSPEGALSRMHMYNHAVHAADYVAIASGFFFIHPLLNFPQGQNNGGMVLQGVGDEGREESNIHGNSLYWCGDHGWHGCLYNRLVDVRFNLVKMLNVSTMNLTTRGSDPWPHLLAADSTILMNSSSRALCLCSYLPLGAFLGMRNIECRKLDMQLRHILPKSVWHHYDLPPCPEKLITSVEEVFLQAQIFATRAASEQNNKEYEVPKVKELVASLPLERCPCHCPCKEYEALMRTVTRKWLKICQKQRMVDFMKEH